MGQEDGAFPWDPTESFMGPPEAPPESAVPSAPAV